MSDELLFREWVRYLHILHRTVGRYKPARIQEFSIEPRQPRTLAEVQRLDAIYAEITAIEREVNR